MDFFLDHRSKTLLLLLAVPVVVMAVCISWLIVPIIVREVVPAVVKSVAS